MTQIDPQLIETFLAETQEHLDSLETALIELENDHHNEEILQQIFRNIHNIKGSSGFLGLDSLAKLGHSMENLVSNIRDDKLKVNEDIVTILLKGTDRLRLMASSIDDSHKVPYQDITQEIDTFIQEELKAEAPPHPAPPVKSTISPDIQKSLEMFSVNPEDVQHFLNQKHLFYIIHLYIFRDIQDQNILPITIIKDLEPLGEILDSHLDTDNITCLEDALNKDICCSILFSTIMQLDLLHAIVNLPDDQIIPVGPEDIKEWTQHFQGPMKEESKKSPSSGHNEQPPIEEVDITLTSPQKTYSEGSVRVSISVLDDLMNLAGEMVLARNQLISNTLDSKNLTPAVSGILQKINSVTSELQGKVMFTQLQSMDMLLSKFKRYARDLAKKLDKKIILQTQGEYVELDKSIIEKLSDPLTHIIRNCADHGIESVSERTAQGKPPEGVITITANHAGSQVHIEVTDDGRGIDPNRIKNKAIEKGIIDSTEAESMTPHEFQQLVFVPGLSTSEVITNISGRGVGMDVVKTNIEELGGNIELSSEIGMGTRISIRVPMSLAIVPAMIVKTKNKKFAIPQVNIQEVVQIDRINQIESLHDAYVLRLRDELLPIIDLQSFLSNTKGKPDEKGFVVVLKIDQFRYGLFVNTLLDIEEIVVKPLSNYLKDSQCYSGTTILGDGTVVMILDTSGIMQMSKINTKSTLKNIFRNVIESSPKSLTENQNILLFKNGTEETFALNLDIVSKIRLATSNQIEKVGEAEYLQHEEKTLRLVRLHNYLEVKKPETKFVEKYYVIIPKMMQKPIGIIANEIEDTLQKQINLDKSAVHGPCILGSTILNGKIILFVDIYSLSEEINPELKPPAKEIEYLKKKRILLVEDTPFFRTVIHNMLIHLVGDVDVVQDGLEAWEKLQHESYDLIVTDIEMPRMDGIELTRKIKSSNKLKDTPIVALTSLSNPIDKKNAEDAGVDAYETKLDKGQLYSTLKNIFKSND